MAHALQKHGWWHVSVSNSMGFWWHFMHSVGAGCTCSFSELDDEEDIGELLRRWKKKKGWRVGFNSYREYNDETCVKWFDSNR